MNVHIFDCDGVITDTNEIKSSAFEFVAKKYLSNKALIKLLEFHKNKRQVRTASIEQVRQPMNNKSIGAWKNYDQFLGNLITTLKAK